MAVAAFSGAPSAFGEEVRRTSRLPQSWLDAVVSIERAERGGKASPRATAFLVRSPREHVLLVTARHAILGPDGKPYPDLAYRLDNRASGTSLVYENDLRAAGYGGWFLSRRSDVACRFLAWPTDVRITTIPRSRFLSRLAVNAGAPIVTLGFPLGLRSLDEVRPMARAGMVARSDERAIVADTLVQRGNSGGPVVYMPPPGAASGGLVDEIHVIGLVSAYRTSRQPVDDALVGDPSVQQNVGLTYIAPADEILALFEREDVRRLDRRLSGGGLPAPDAKPNP